MMEESDTYLMIVDQGKREAGQRGHLARWRRTAWFARRNDQSRPRFHKRPRTVETAHSPRRQSRILARDIGRAMLASGTLVL